MDEQALEPEKDAPAVADAREEPATPEKARWITRIEVEAFRGIPGNLALELSGDKHPSASVILGDNGSGKSSIVDALEFGLQGEIQGFAEQKAANFARCKSVKALPRTKVELSDGSTIERSIEFEDPRTESLAFDPKPVSEFSRTPLVLRRADILRFWYTLPVERQLIFAGYFTVEGPRTRETPQERIERIQAERLRAETNWLEALNELAGAENVRIDSIPRDLAEFDRWIESRFHGGYDADAHRFRDKRKLSRYQQATIKRSRSAIRALRSIDRELEAEREQASMGERVPELAEVLEEASADVTEAFHAIAPHSAVRGFHIRIGAESAVALHIDLELSNGLIANPLEVLSEANRDLVALLIFVAIAKAAAARGRAKVIVLDDVFQSVDAPVRLATLDYLIREMRGWQLIITAHDRLWREQVRAVFQRHSVPVAAFAITDWSFEHGPAIKVTQGDIGIPLRDALESGDSTSVALHAGRLLEQISNVLSWKLSISVRRRQNDLYSLGDLWPPVRKKLEGTDAVECTAEVDRYLHLRNFLGAHSNEWAESASLGEARRFGEAVLNLLGYVWCPSCHRWVEESPTRRAWMCRCGKTTLSKRGKKQKGG